MLSPSLIDSFKLTSILLSIISPICREFKLISEDTDSIFVETGIKEIEKLDNPFDLKVANAMANENVSMTIKNNKS